MSQQTTVYITQNFENNLDTVQQYFVDNEVPQQFSTLIENLFGTIIPNLKRFPHIGIDFLGHQPGSIEAVNLIESIHRHLTGEGEIREYITGDYLILYTLMENNLYLLCIKHHKQLAFDFVSTWINN